MQDGELTIGGIPIRKRPPFCLPCNNLLEFIEYFLDAYHNKDLEQLDFLIDSGLSKYSSNQQKQYATDKMFEFTLDMYFRDDLSRDYQQNKWLDFDKSKLNTLLKDAFFDDYCTGVIRGTTNRDDLIKVIEEYDYHYIEFYTFYKVLSEAAVLLEYNRTHMLWWYLCFEDLIEQLFGLGFYSIINNIYQKYGWSWFSINRHGFEPSFDAIMYKWGYYSIFAAKKTGIKDNKKLRSDLIDLYTEFCIKCAQSEKSSMNDELIDFFKEAINHFDDDVLQIMELKLQKTQHKSETLKQDYESLKLSYMTALENIKLFQSMDDLEDNDKEVRILKNIYLCLPKVLDIENPIDGFNDVWEKVSKDSRRDIYQSINLFDLMHDTEFSILALLRSIERELELNFFVPFRKSAKFKSISDLSCTTKKVEKTHIALQKPVTLGTVPFIGRSLRKKDYVESSSVLKAFFEFLGEKQDIFIKICSDMDKYKVGKDSISIINIRNGIAHGDPEITENCDESCYKEVIRLVYEPPIKILFSIIINSMRV